MSNQLQIATKKQVSSILSSANVKKRFTELLGSKAPGFMTSIINISGSYALAGADEQSIVESCAVAAALDLPIDPNLGFAYIVPYNTKVNNQFVKKAQFQMG